MGSIRYDIQTSISDSNAVQLIYCAISRYDDTWQSILHSHTNAELFYCVSGHGLLQIGDEHPTLDAGDFFLINPAVEHTEYSDADGKLEYIVIGVSGICFLDADGKLPTYRLIRDRSNQHELLPYFKDMFREVSKQKEGYSAICLNILSILLVKMQRSTRVDISESTLIKGPALCEEIKRLIDERFSKELTLDTLAEFAHISKYHLAHMFQKYYGISPMQYLSERRIQEARYLLLHTDNNLSQICSTVGFSSPSYFSQVFSRAEGLSPSAFRKKAQTRP